MKCFRLGWYDPCQPDAVEIIKDKSLPTSRRRLARIARMFNRMAVKEPDVFLLARVVCVRRKGGAS